MATGSGSANTALGGLTLSPSSACCYPRKGSDIRCIGRGEGRGDAAGLNAVGGAIGGFDRNLQAREVNIFGQWTWRPTSGKRRAVDPHEELVAAARSTAICFGDERLPGNYVC